MDSKSNGINADYFKEVIRVEFARINKPTQKGYNSQQVEGGSNLNQDLLVKIPEYENVSNSKHDAQLKRVYNAFKAPSSMLEIANRTGIERANICWYVRNLRTRNRIQQIEKGYCSISKQLVGIYSTDEALFCRNDNQLELF